MGGSLENGVHSAVDLEVLGPHWKKCIGFDPTIPMLPMNGIAMTA